MTTFTALKKMVAVCVAGTALTIVSPGASMASGCSTRPEPAYHCTWKTIVTYKYKRVPYTRWITVYDDYGCAHRVKKTFYKTIKVPVKKRVRVCY